MAKTNGTWKYYLGVTLAFLLAAGGVVYNHGVQAEASERTEADVVALETSTAANIATLKEDGCDPAEEANDSILVIQTKMDNFQAAQERIEGKIDTNQNILLEAIKAEK